MNKKKILGIVIAIMVTALSTSAIAFASQASSKATKDVVKVAEAKTKDTAKAASNKSVKVNITNANTVKPTSVDKFLDISNAEAIQKAKGAISSMFGADVDKDGFTKAHVYRPEDFNKSSKYTDIQNYHITGGNPTIDVIFSKCDNADGQYIFRAAEVDISLIDGKIKEAEFHNDLDTRLKDKVQYDDNKVRNIAVQFLKDKGLPTNYKNIRTCAGKPCRYGVLTDVYFDYPDGTTTGLLIDVLNYEVYGYYNQNTPVLQN